MAENFPFGKYVGKSVAYVALTDYPWLAWIHKEGIRNHGLRGEVEVVRKALNSFTSAKKCDGRCDTPPVRFSIANSRDMGWIVDYPYAFCASADCWNSTGFDGSRVAMPIKYDSMLEFTPGSIYGSSRAAVAQFQEVLNSHAGFAGKRTQLNCQSFIDDIVRKTGVSPPPTSYPEYRRLRQCPED